MLAPLPVLLLSVLRPSVPMAVAVACTVQKQVRLLHMTLSSAYNEINYTFVVLICLSSLQFDVVLKCLHE